MSKWDPLPALRLIGALARQSIAERIAGGALFAVIVAAILLVGAGFGACWHALRSLLPVLLVGLVFGAGCEAEGLRVGADAGALIVAPSRGAATVFDGPEVNVDSGLLGFPQSDAGPPASAAGPDSSWSEAGAGDGLRTCGAGPIVILDDCGLAGGWHCEAADREDAPCLVPNLSRLIVRTCSDCGVGR